ncbi:MAG: hypothetical protein SFV19_06595 [Rhodospirillaceae bacterium]|nr:hypothetical protein [Rhodospirillaceae bacterium]
MKSIVAILLRPAGWYALAFVLNFAFLSGQLLSTNLIFPRGVCENEQLVEGTVIKLGKLTCHFDADIGYFYIFIGPLIFVTLAAGLIEYFRAIARATRQDSQSSAKRT